MICCGGERRGDETRSRASERVTCVRCDDVQCRGFRGVGSRCFSKSSSASEAKKWRLETSIWAGRQFRGGENRGFYDQMTVEKGCFPEPVTGYGGFQATTNLITK